MKREKGISLKLKQALAILLALVAYHLQTSSAPWFLWIPFLLGAGVLLWVPWTTIGRPRQVKKKEWDPVTHREFELLKEKAEVSEKFSKGKSIKVGVLVFFLFFLPFIIPLMVANIKDKFLLWGILDSGFLLLVVLSSGWVSLWTPGNLDVKAEVLWPILKLLEEKGGFQISPQLLVGQVKSGKKVPVDAKIFAVPEQAPSWLMGIQFQVSVNTVQSKPYPYFYSVIILKPGTLRELFGFSALRSTKKKFPWLLERCGIDDEKLVVELQRQKEVDVIIIRQKTTKSSGYYTDDRRSREIFEEALEILYCLMKNEAKPS